MPHLINSDTESTEAGLVVRRGRMDDVPAAIRLWSAHVNWINVTFGFEDVVQRRLSPDAVSDLFLHYPSAAVEFEGDVVGFGVCRAPELGVLELATLYIDDPYRGRGGGSTVIALLETAAKTWRFGEDGSTEPYVHTLVAYASTGYHPGKQLPPNLFLRAGFTAQRLGPLRARFETEFYAKQIGDGNAPPERVRNIRFRAPKPLG